MVNTVEAVSLKELILLQRLSTVSRSWVRGGTSWAPSCSRPQCWLACSPTDSIVSRRHCFNLSFLPLALPILLPLLLRHPLSLVGKGYNAGVPLVAEPSVNISPLCFDQLQDFMLTTTHYKRNFPDESERTLVSGSRDTHGERSFTLRQFSRIVVGASHQNLLSSPAAYCWTDLQTRSVFSLVHLAFNPIRKGKGFVILTTSWHSCH